jgi:hypothetical protein
MLVRNRRPDRNRLFALAATSLSIILGCMWAHADQLDDVCKRKCSDALARYRKSAGSSPPAGFFDTCMQSCKTIMLIRSEQDIPAVCKSNCAKVLQTMKMSKTPGAMEECVANCTKRTLENFRRMKNQQSPPAKP